MKGVKTLLPAFLQGAISRLGRAVLVLLCVAVAATLTAATGYQVNYGANQDITEWSTCRNVDNAHASGKAIFVPTNTSTEWTQFYSHPPAGVTVSACAPTCSGQSQGGYCWYKGAAGQSCTTVCSSHGGVVTAGIINYAGSSGTSPNCLAVVKLFYPATTSVLAPTSQAVGCSYTAGYQSRYTSPATTAAASYSQAQRYCSCTN